MILRRVAIGVTCKEGEEDSFMDRETNVCLNLCGLEMRESQLRAKGIVRRFESIFPDLFPALGRALLEHCPMLFRPSFSCGAGSISDRRGEGRGGCGAGGACGPC